MRHSHFLKNISQEAQTERQQQHQDKAATHSHSDRTGMKKGRTPYRDTTFGFEIMKKSFN